MRSSLLRRLRSRLKEQGAVLFEGVGVGQEHGLRSDDLRVDDLDLPLRLSMFDLVHTRNHILTLTATTVGREITLNGANKEISVR